MSFVRYKDFSVAPASLASNTGYRFWRLIVKGINDPQGLYALIAEINLRETASVDSPMEGIFTASTQYDGSFGPAAMADDEALTGWCTAAGEWNNAYWQVRLPERREVQEIALQAYNNGLGAGQMPKDFDIIASDNLADWFTILSVTNESNWAPGEIRTWSI